MYAIHDTGGQLLAGPSARGNTSNPAPAYDYDDLPRLAQLARGNHGAEEQVGCNEQVPDAQRSGVAAKTGAEVIGPARNTDLVLDSFRGLGAGKQKTVRTAGSVDELRTTFEAYRGGRAVACSGQRHPRCIPTA